MRTAGSLSRNCRGQNKAYAKAIGRNTVQVYQSWYFRVFVPRSRSSRIRNDRKGLRQMKLDGQLAAAVSVTTHAGSTISDESYWPSEAKQRAQIRTIGSNAI